MRYLSLAFLLISPLSIADPIEILDLVNLNKLEEFEVHYLTGRRADDPPHLHGFKFKDTSVVGETELQNTITAELQYALDSSHSRFMAMCFNPRHAISYVMSERSVDFLICYECKNIGIYVDGELLDRVTFEARSEERLNSLFRTAGLKR